MEKKELVKKILERGISNVIPSNKELEEILLSEKKLNVYLGIDPTATRIHLGHAVPLRKLRDLSRLGHNVTFLIGDFTAKIGDTSDKESERPKLSDEEIKNNFSLYKEMASKILDLSSVKVVFNSEWLSKMTFADVLDLSSHFSVNDFVSRELIRKRLDDGTRVSLPETLYPLMQGYDSYYLDTDIQIGAVDQTFNMQAGRALQKKLRNKESYILCTGYLTGTDGRKMSKSWGNAIWMDDGPEEVFRKVMSVPDNLMREYFILGTELEIKQIDRNMERIDEGVNPMEVKRELARQMVLELHGKESVEGAEKAFERVVINKESIETVEYDFPFSEDEVLATLSLIEFAVEKGVLESKADGKRIWQQGGLWVNKQKIEPSETTLNSELLKGDSIEVRFGKFKHMRIKKASK